MDQVHICIVDDDPFLLQLWRDSLPDVKIDAFLDAEHFLEYFAKDQSARGYFFDYYLNGKMSGEDLCRKVRAVLPTTPIYLFSDFKGPKPAACTAAIGKVVPSRSDLLQLLSRSGETI